jgi:5-methylcytosine-specific restriction endonuclease McrA
MADRGSDPLALGQRIVAILELGARVATYKLATLTALVDHCIERLPSDPEAELAVPLDDLAHRVMELYWPQVRPFDGTIHLRQITGGTARILRAVEELRDDSGAGWSALGLEMARLRAPNRYAAARDDVALTLARQPLHRLQRVGGSHDPFLYDDSWMHDRLSRAQVRAHGSAVVLRPGVAFSLARLSGLLKPTLEILWTDDVRRMNRAHFQGRDDDLAAHLFGRDRVSLAPVRSVLQEAFGPHCFYCGTPVSAAAEVDHVLPWSRVALDGLANLVLACRPCNGDKRQALPSVVLVGRAVQRDRVVLEQAAEAVGWPTQYERVRDAARGLYLGEPAGAATWDGYHRTARLDLAYAPDWLR